MASPWNAGRALRLAEDAAAASSTTLTAVEIQQFSQDLYDPKHNQLEDSVFEVLSQSLVAGDVADSGELMLELKEAIEGVEYPSGAVINHVGNLTKGVTEAQAARIWELYDHDGNGVMDRSELRRLVHDLGNAIIRRLSNKVERISKQMSKPKDSAKELLKALDKNRDGRVQKVEFVNLAIRGLGNIDAMTADERGGSSRGPPSKRTKVQDEARALKTARRGEPGFEMIHMLMLRVANLKAGLANLATGVTEEEAEALWKTFDADGDGTLDLAELQALFTEQATTAIQSIYARIASYADALSRSKTVDELLDKFDADGDGKVQKSEFIKLAVTGVKIPTD